MNNRREFFRKAGIFGALAIAPVATTVVVSLPKEEKMPEDISHLAPPDTATSIRLTGSYEEPKQSSDMVFTTDGEERMRLGASGFYVTPSPLPTHGVDMTVGKDNRLWIKIGNEWKRVAVES